MVEFHKERVALKKPDKKRFHTTWFDLRQVQSQAEVGAGNDGGAELWETAWGLLRMEMLFPDLGASFPGTLTLWSFPKLHAHDLCAVIVCK